MRYSIPAMALALLLIHDTACADTGEVIETGDIVQGKSQQEYANAWWQWAVSMPEEDSPVRDKTGSKCGVNQEGPVWFLAGGYGSSKIHRECTIPSGKQLFFPVINMVYYPGGADARPTCESVKQSASLNNQYLKTFRVNVDGREYINPVFFRRSPEKCFDLIARKPKKYHPETVYPSATDGYWVMLKPLAPGKHGISFRAEYDRPGSRFGSMFQDIEYSIEVPEP